MTLYVPSPDHESASVAFEQDGDDLPEGFVRLGTVVGRLVADLERRLKEQQQ